MTALEILAAWNAAAAQGGAAFYGAFEKATGFTKEQVIQHFADWNRLRHEVAEEVAEENGTTIREAGFQAYLADIKRIGRPRIACYEEIDDEDGPHDPNPRGTKDWPAAEDCPGCDGQVGNLASHRFGCTVRGARQQTLSATKNPDGSFKIIK